MPTPEFVTSLRAHIGHNLLWLSTAAGVVLDDDGRVLLGRRADTGTWGLPGGIIEPGEEPADAAVREIFEETGVIAVPEALAAVTVSEQITYQHGDVVQYLEILFRCRAVGGTARVNDSESVEVSWHALGGLPDLHASTLGRISQAVAGTPQPAYAFSGLEKVLGPGWLARPGAAAPIEPDGPVPIRPCGSAPESVPSAGSSPGRRSGSGRRRPARWAGRRLRRGADAEVAVLFPVILAGR